MTGPSESRDRPIAAPRRSAALARRAGLGLLMAAGAVLAARAWLPSPSAHAQSVPPPPPPVTVSAPLQRNLANVTSFTGQFSAVDYVELRAQVSGYLTEIHFTDGQLVHKGDLLFVIDPRPYQIALEQAQAQFQTAAASLDLANQELVRATQLKRNDFASGETVDQRVQQQRSAQAAVAQAKAAIASAQLNLVFTHITAPLTGRISSHRVSIGSLVMGGPGAAATTLLTTIVSLDPIYLDFDMSENDYLAYEHGRQGATADRRSCRPSSATSRTGRIAARSTSSTTSWTAAAAPSMPAPRCPIPICSSPPASSPGCACPRRSPARCCWCRMRRSSPTSPNKMLMTVAADGTVVPKRVEIGPLDGELRVIESGLLPTDQVIINGLVRARPGGKVTPQPGTIAQPEPSAEEHVPCACPISSSTARSSPWWSRPSSPSSARSRISRCPSRNIPKSPRRRSRSPPPIPAPRPRRSARSVATPLEQQINGVENMLYFSSQSTGDGKLTLTVTFKLGTNLDTAQVLTQNRVSQALPRLPDAVQRLGVTVNKSSPDLMMVIHLRSPDGTRDQLYLSNYATLHVKDQLSRIDGVGTVTVFGGRDYAMRIWLDPDKVAAHDLTAGEVVAALQAQNVQVSAGVLGQPPMPGASAFQLNVQTLGRLTDPAQFADIIVKSDNAGHVTRVRDIARVDLGAQDYGSNGYLDGKGAVPIIVYQQPGSNALATAAKHPRHHAGSVERLPARPHLQHRLRHHGLHRPVGARGAEDHPGGHRPRRRGRHRLPANLARLHHPHRRHPDLADRHLRHPRAPSASR